LVVARNGLAASSHVVLVLVGRHVAAAQVLSVSSRRRGLVVWVLQRLVLRLSVSTLRVFRVNDGLRLSLEVVVEQLGLGLTQLRLQVF
jgi:hypothetical protein